jgi:hypothetical protein
MSEHKLRPDGSRFPNGAEAQERKALRADEARLAMADYQSEAQAALNRMANLRALRLAMPPVEASKPRRANKNQLKPPGV